MFHDSAMARLAKFRHDLEVIQARCMASSSCFQNFITDGDGSVQFCVQQGERKGSYVLLPIDYPSLTICDTEDPTFCINSQSSLLELLQQLADTLHVPLFGSGAQLTQDKESCSSVTCGSGDGGSNTSHANRFGLDSQDGTDYDSELDTDDHDEESLFATVHPSLRNDIKEVNDMFGTDDSTATFLHKKGLDNCTVTLQLRIDSCEALEYRTLLAWGLRPDDVLLINCFDVPAVRYRDVGFENEFSISVSTLMGSRSVVSAQLEKVTERFMRDNWLRRTSENIWIKVLSYIQHRLLTLNDHCIVCDMPQNVDMMLPSVCERELCVFSYENLGVMFDIVGQVNSYAEVVDLLISLARCAAFHSRCEQIFDPYPNLSDPSNPTELKMSAHRKDFVMLRKLMEKVPCMVRLQKLFKNRKHSELKTVAAQCDPMVIPLVRWIVASNRTSIIPLSAEQMLPFMHTPHQFLMMLDSPAKEAIFRRAKQTHGDRTLFLFHGSPIENWHSILRRGLMNMSGTKNQLHGAVHGNGIYLSPSLDLSMGYSHTAGYRSDPQYIPYFGGLSFCREYLDDGNHSCSVSATHQFISFNPRCIAICEVVDSPSLRKHEPMHIYVEENPDHVCTRFFFVYNVESMGAANTMTDVNLATDCESSDAIRAVVQSLQLEKR